MKTSIKTKMNFNYNRQTAVIYKGHYIYNHNGVFRAFITNGYYNSLADCKRAITTCLKNGWELTNI